MIKSMEQIKIERSIFTDAWNILKKYYGIEGLPEGTASDDAWSALVADIIQINGKGETEAQRRLSHSIADGLLSYFEHVEDKG